MNWPLPPFLRKLATPAPAPAEDPPYAPAPDKDPRPDWKQAALDDFAQWLDDLESDAQPDDDDDDSPPLGLADVVDSVAALRTETAALARNAAKIVRDNEALRKESDEDREQTARTLLAVQKQLRDVAAQRDASARAEILEFLFDAADDLRSVVRRHEARGPVKTGFFRTERIPADLLDDLHLLLRRSEDALRLWNVRPIAGVGAPFDPQTMRALATTDLGEAPPGCVSEIVRQGIFIDQRPLRIAQVNVEKESTP
jgi:molecular chaperone GrpE (heat shock protein)